MKKRNAKYLALFLALSMAVSPLSYTRAYAMDSEVETQGAAVEDAQSTPIMEETENTEETADSVGETGGEAETPAGEKSDVTEADITGADAADSEKSDIVENEASVDKETDASDSKETGAVKRKISVLQKRRKGIQRSERHQRRKQMRRCLRIRKKRMWYRYNRQHRVLPETV